MIFVVVYTYKLTNFGPVLWETASLEDFNGAKPGRCLF